MARKPAIDSECCIGCEACTQICPEVFHMVESNNGHAHEKAAVYNPTGAPRAKIEEAMDNCPAACIYWV
jgi:ferredoxin